LVQPSVICIPGSHPELGGISAAFKIRPCP
jgi:hypothetical protein